MAQMLRRMVVLLVVCAFMTGVNGPALQPGGRVWAAPSTGRVVVRVGLKGAVVNMDTMRDGNNSTNVAVSHMLETLLVEDEKGNIVPHLATSWTVSKDDPTVWTFKLRPGVTFHDGTPFNAQAVAASFKRLQNPAFKLDRGVQYYGLLQSVTAIDPQTVQFKTKEPWGVLPTFLTYIASGVVGPAVAEQERIQSPVGTGPFKFAEWKPGELVRMVKNDRYWGPAPAIDELDFYEVPEDATRVAKLIAGELDFIADVPPVELPRLRGTRGLTVHEDPTDRVMWLQLNTRKRPLDDLNVRQAIKYAIDINGIVKGVLKGQAVPADSLTAPGVFGYQPDPGYHEYNPAKARALLAKAGYERGFTTSITYGTKTYPLQQEVLTAIQAQLAQVGITVRLNPLEWAVYLQTLRKPLADSPIEMNSWAWSSVIGDVGFLIGSNFVPERMPPSCCNVMFWENKGVVDLFRQAQQETDITKRAGYLKVIQRLINQQVPQVHLYVYRQATAETSKLQGVVVPANQIWRLDRARVAR